jgi:hypothetical protein
MKIVRIFLCTKLKCYYEAFVASHTYTLVVASTGSAGEGPLWRLTDNLSLGCYSPNICFPAIRMSSTTDFR